MKLNDVSSILEFVWHHADDSTWTSIQMDVGEYVRGSIEISVHYSVWVFVFNSMQFKTQIFRRIKYEIE
jgi:hypothetical protein